MAPATACVLRRDCRHWYRKEKGTWENPASGLHRPLGAGSDSLSKIILDKVPGAENMADVLTKYVDKKLMDAALTKMSLEKRDGRPACAPIAMGAQ